MYFYTNLYLFSLNKTHIFKKKIKLKTTTTHFFLKKLKKIKIKKYNKKT